MTSYDLKRGKLISTKAVVKELYHMASWFVSKNPTPKPRISVNRNFFVENVKALVAQSCPSPCDPMHPTGLSCPWDPPG